ncbi:MAG: hypothetical protein ACM3O4_05725 [Ignavibacteriales bacterium]
MPDKEFFRKMYDVNGLTKEKTYAKILQRIGKEKKAIYNMKRIVYASFLFIIVFAVLLKLNNNYNKSNYNSNELFINYINYDDNNFDMLDNPLKKEIQNTLITYEWKYEKNTLENVIHLYNIKLKYYIPNYLTQINTLCIYNIYENEYSECSIEHLEENDSLIKRYMIFSVSKNEYPFRDDKYFETNLKNIKTTTYNHQQFLIYKLKQSSIMDEKSSLIIVRFKDNDLFYDFELFGISNDDFISFLNSI